MNNDAQHLHPSTRFVSFIADGHATIFDFNYIVWDISGLAVYLDDVLQTAGYTVTGLGQSSGGSVVFSRAPADKCVVCILGSTERARAVDYNEYMTLRASAMNIDHDYQEAQIQENTRDIRRAMITPITDGVSLDMTLPSIADRAGGYLAFDASGEPIAVGDAQNIVHGLSGTGSSPGSVMLWQDASGLQSGDSRRVFGAPGGAAILDINGVVPDDELPERGHRILSNGALSPYKHDINFSKSFSVTDDTSATNIDLNTKINHIGSGKQIAVDFHPSNVLNARTLTGVGLVSLSDATDGTIQIQADSPVRMFQKTFAISDWESGMVSYRYAAHNISDTSALIVTVRDASGHDVRCDISVSEYGTVVIYSEQPFSGTVYIYGGYQSSHSGLSNVLTAKGDIVYSSDNSGTPARLPIGHQNDVLMVDSSGALAYGKLGGAARAEFDQIGGVPLINGNGVIDAKFLPYNTLVVKGSFGSATSTAGGDLPMSDVLDGSVYICDINKYHSSVANYTFSAGQWAIYSVSGWLHGTSNTGGMPVGSVTGYAGSALPDYYLSCNGASLLRSLYPELFTAIGTIYGSEDNDHFSLPAYNTSGIFLQGGTSAGRLVNQGLPNIRGCFTVDSNAKWVSAPFSYGGRLGGQAGSYDGNGKQCYFDASTANQIYGASDRVQPPAQTVVFIIKYQ